MKLKKNDPCWCQSGKKYKNCHEKWDDTINVLRLQGQRVPDHRLIKSPEDIRLIERAAKINNGILDTVGDLIKPGVTTEEIDQYVYEYTTSHGGIPAPLGFEGYPKSVCTSINDEICHGIPDEKIVLKEGDIINVDCTTIYRGHYADASRMFTVGEVSKEAQDLIDVAKECMEAGIAAVRPWGHFGDIGAAIQKVAEEHGYSVVREFGGHGVGNGFHEDPFVYHVGIPNTGMVIAPGMMFTIEPMINAGKAALYIDEANGWTAHTKDGSLSAQWENTILVTEHGIKKIAY